MICINSLKLLSCPDDFVFHHEDVRRAQLGNSAPTQPFLGRLQGDIETETHTETETGTEIDVEMETQTETTTVTECESDSENTVVLARIIHAQILHLHD